MPTQEFRQYKLSPDDGDVLSERGRVLLLCGDYNPAHIGYFRAVQELSSCPDYDQIWICPIGAGQDAVNMATILATDAAHALNRQIGCCLSGQKSIPELLKWCKRTRPSLKFTTARLHGFKGPTDLEIYFAGQVGCQTGTMAIYLPKYLAIGPDIIQHIQAGHDEQRNFLAPVWEYIQKEKLYRRH